MEAPEKKIITFAASHSPTAVLPLINYVCRPSMKTVFPVLPTFAGFVNDYAYLTLGNTPERGVFPKWRFPRPPRCSVLNNVNFITSTALALCKRMW